MTTHDKDKIIAAAKEADSGFTGDESFNLGTSLVGLEAIECFYAIAFEAGQVAGFSASIEACQAVGPKEYPNKLITDGYVDAIRARGDMK